MGHVTQCPCGAELRIIHFGTRTWTCTCPECYDGTPDSDAVSRVLGHGDTREEAIQDWHERRAEASA